MHPFISILLIFGIILLFRILLNEIKGYFDKGDQLQTKELQVKDKHIAELKKEIVNLQMELSPGSIFMIFRVKDPALVKFF